MLDGIKKHNILRVPPTADVAKTGRFIVVLDMDTPPEECENLAKEIEKNTMSKIDGKICEKSFVAKIITVELSGSDDLKNQLETVSIQCT